MPAEAPLTAKSLTPARELSALIGDEMARTAIEAGWRAIRELNSGSAHPLVRPGVADYVATVVILATVEAGLADPKETL